MKLGRIDRRSTVLKNIYFTSDSSNAVFRANIASPKRKKALSK
jgi:hypothetical protein